MVTLALIRYASPGMQIFVHHEYFRDIGQGTELDGGRFALIGMKTVYLAESDARRKG
jgi:RES domain-containing protein